MGTSLDSNRILLEIEEAGHGSPGAVMTPGNGGGGIRTHERLATPTVFETAPFNRSGTPPGTSKTPRWGARRASPRGEARPAGTLVRDQGAVTVHCPLT